MSGMLDGKVALITGASSGLGQATAVAMAAEGARVVVAGRRLEDLEKTASLITTSGGVAIPCKTDVAKSEDVARLVAFTVRQFGKLDCAFNNAGIEGETFKPLADYPEAVWDEVIAINLKGLFLCMKYELPHLVTSKGSIVNMASIAGMSGGRVGAAYYASKHGVVGLTRAAAIEYADKGVRVNAVAPAVIRTPMADRTFFHDEKLTSRVTAMHPLGRLGEPEEVARAVVWLCSSNASFTTGHVLPVDGGWLVP